MPDDDQAAATTLSWCTTCRADTPFEQPECGDHDHGVDCPDWACVHCGEAIVVAFGILEPVRSARPSSRGAVGHVA